MKYSLLIIIIVHRFSSIQSTIWQFGSRTHWQCEEMTVPFGPPAYGILFTSLLSGGGGGGDGSLIISTHKLLPPPGLLCRYRRA